MPIALNLSGEIRRRQFHTYPTSKTTVFGAVVDEALLPYLQTTVTYTQQPGHKPRWRYSHSQRGTPVYHFCKTHVEVACCHTS